MIYTSKVYKKQIKIDKGNGKYRKIFIPTTNTKKVISNNIKVLEELFEALITINKMDEKIIQGFRKGKSAVTNAKQHIGKQYTISMDLKDFFDTVHFNMVGNFFPDSKRRNKIFNVDKNPTIKYSLTQKKARHYFFIKERLPQGFASSPILANIAFLKTDYLISTYLEKKIDEEVIYTRYADDLTFSFNNKENIRKIIQSVKKIVETNKFIINKKKTKVYNGKSGNRIITGVAVNDEGIVPTRKTRRKLRAAKHQQNSNSQMGLEEWMRLKEPKKNIPL